MVFSIFILHFPLSCDTHIVYYYLLLLSLSFLLIVVVNIYTYIIFKRFYVRIFFSMIIKQQQNVREQLNCAHFYMKFAGWTAVAMLLIFFLHLTPSVGSSESIVIIVYFLLAVQMWYTFFTFHFVVFTLRSVSLSVVTIHSRSCAILA